jgi:hypothetical protein
MAFAFPICNMKIISTTKLALLCTAIAGALLTFSSSARAVTIGEGHEFGFVNFGIHSGDGDRLTYVNHLIGMAFRSDERASGQYLRPDTSTPHAVLTDHRNGWNAGSHADSREIVTIPTIGGGPGGVGGAVPDGGITVMLLGAALGALGIARRYIRT